MAQVFVDESGQYFYQNVDGSQQQMVVVSSDPAEGSEGESGGADGSSVILTPEEDSMHEVVLNTAHYLHQLDSFSLSWSFYRFAFTSCLIFLSLQH